MAYCPTPILIVSASINRGELFKTYEALAAGAVDVLDKPNGHATDSGWEAGFLATVKLVSRIRVIMHPRGRHAPTPRLPETSSVTPVPHGNCQVIGLGASTGGPGAIVQILHTLPTHFQLPILLVVHIGEPFGTAFADWLDGQSERSVRFAEDGAAVAALRGCVALAPADRHLSVRNGRLRISHEAERHSCRPSVDILFESLAHEYGATAAVCLLTGMGRDGAAGMLAVRNAGGRTIAQDEASCVVYGMPREAVQLGAAERVLPLDQIAPALAALEEGKRT
jgi:two-component system chemotaxis response regulator CheB